MGGEDADDSPMGEAAPQAEGAPVDAPRFYGETQVVADEAIAEDETVAAEGDETIGCDDTIACDDTMVCDDTMALEPEAEEIQPGKSDKDKEAQEGAQAGASEIKVVALGALPEESQDLVNPPGAPRTAAPYPHP